MIPAHNEELFVGAALRSVLLQAWDPRRLEAVVVDNGSCDSTAAVVDDFRRRHPDCRAELVRVARPGVARARNLGALRARGAYLMFLDADSRADPLLVERIMARVRSGYECGCVRIVGDSDDLLDRGFFELVEFGKRIFDIRAQMFFCRRDLFLSQHGFDESLCVAEDRDFLCRLKQDGVPVCRIDEAWIATSPRRLRRLPLRLAMVTTLARWALGQAGLGRRWHY